MHFPAALIVMLATYMAAAAPLGASNSVSVPGDNNIVGAAVANALSIVAPRPKPAPPHALVARATNNPNVAAVGWMISALNGAWSDDIESNSQDKISPEQFKADVARLTPVFNQARQALLDLETNYYGSSERMSDAEMAVIKQRFLAVQAALRQTQGSYPNLSGVVEFGPTW